MLPLLGLRAKGFVSSSVLWIQLEDGFQISARVSLSSQTTQTDSTVEVRFDILWVDPNRTGKGLERFIILVGGVQCDSKLIVEIRIGGSESEGLTVGIGGGFELTSSVEAQCQLGVERDLIFLAKGELAECSLCLFLALLGGFKHPARIGVAGIEL